MRLYFFLPLFLFSANLPVKVSAPYACLLNIDTRKVVYGKNIHQKIFPGSVTKLAVALYLFDECECDLDRVVTCRSDVLKVTTEKKKIESNFTLPPYILESDGCTIYLRGGEKILFRSLLHAYLLKSANDTGNIIASQFFETIGEFQENVNRYCKSIGCRNTHFLNPHGLHHPDHYTTAYDLTIIAAEVQKHPKLVKILKTIEYDIEKTNFSPPRKMKNMNLLIRPTSKYYMAEVIGGKTGYHREAKFNIVAFAKDEKRNLACAVNKAETKVQRFIDCRKILSAAFSETPQERILFNAHETVFRHKYIWAAKDVCATIGQDIYYMYYSSEEEDIKVNLQFNEEVTSIFAGDVVGSIDIVLPSSEVLASYDIFATNDVGYSFIYKIRHLVSILMQTIKRMSNRYLYFLLFILFLPFLYRRVKKII